MFSTFSLNLSRFSLKVEMSVSCLSVCAIAENPFLVDGRLLVKEGMPILAYLQHLRVNVVTLIFWVRNCLGFGVYVNQPSVHNWGVCGKRAVAMAIGVSDRWQMTWVKFFLGLSLALRSHYQFQASHWFFLPPSLTPSLPWKLGNLETWKLGNSVPWNLNNFETPMLY